MESAEEVKTKMKMMFSDMELAAKDIADAGTYKGTADTLTPRGRFTKDEKVPESTRYAISSIIVDLSFKPTQEEEDAYEEWARSMKTENALSQKSQASDCSNLK
jgi:hypothetical protein